MSYYRQHLFFCVNERSAPKECCYQKGAMQARDYVKNRLKKLKLTGPHEIRVNQSGCLGRCQEGPVLVIYPEGVWYSYQNEADLEEIIQSHILQKTIVTRLLISEPKSTTEQSL